MKKFKSDLKSIIVNNAQKTIFHLGFYDAFGYLTVYDEESIVDITLDPPPTVILDFKTSTKLGLAKFEKFLFKGERNTSYKIRLNKLGFGDFISNQTLPTEFFIRYCFVGELDLQKEQLCEICPDDLYSVFVQDKG